MTDQTGPEEVEEMPGRVPVVRVPVLNPADGEEPFAAPADVASQWDFRCWRRA